MLTMRPLRFWSTMIRAANLVQRKTPLSEIAMTLSHSSSVRSRIVFRSVQAALLTRISTPPHFWTTVLTIFSTSLIKIDHGDASPLLGKGLGYIFADITPGTCNYGHLVIQSHQCRTSMSILSASLLKNDSAHPAIRPSRCFFSYQKQRRSSRRSSTFHRGRLL